MQRNTSFFWASDAFRDFEDDNSVDDSDSENDFGLNLDEDTIPNNAASMTATATDINEQKLPLVMDETFKKTSTGTRVDMYYGSVPPPGPPPSIPADNRRSVMMNPIKETKYYYHNNSSSGNSLSQSSSTSPKVKQTNRKIDRSHQQSPRTVRRKKIAQIQPHVLRFQVVIWYIGPVNVCQGHVNMRFRITLFWNDIDTIENNNNNTATAASAAADEYAKQIQNSVWTMKGRQYACRYSLNENETVVQETVNVPPVSILNAVSFDSTNEADVTMIDPEVRLMRWTCMYSATLSQGDHMRVDQFPHDSHRLKLKIGILAHRGPGQLWDKQIYNLNLATNDDSQGSTKIPHGLVVDHVTVPDFTFHPDDLLFDFVPLQYGSNVSAPKATGGDSYLQVTLPVQRLSGHYDRSIMPILALLNIVAITCLPRNFDSATASTETMLSIAFVQVGIRLTIDSHLPSVGYPIKMQRILNQCFWLLCTLVIEANTVFFLVIKCGWQISVTDRIDVVTGIVAFLYTCYILVLYYGPRESNNDDHDYSYKLS